MTNRISLSLMAFVLFSGGLAAMEPPVPATVNLPADFQPSEEDFVNKGGKKGRFLGVRELRGRNLTERGGLKPIYVTTAPEEGFLPGDPLKAGDLILAMNGKPFGRDAVYEFKMAVIQANENIGTVTFTRWRRGKSTQIELDMEKPVPDLTRGDSPGDLHDWLLGPTGMNGWVYSVGTREGASRDARQILVTRVEDGTPAAGRIQVGDIILGVDGGLFQQDARKAFAAAIVEAEKQANGGRLTLNVWRKGKTEEVVLTLKTLPDPSPTAPYDCAKTDAIIDLATDYLKEQDLQANWIGYINALGLLATGREDVMPKLKAFAHEICVPGEVLSIQKHTSMLCWKWSYKTLFLTEYYLRTKDDYVLPTIEEYATKIAMGQSGVGTWGHSVAAWENQKKYHGYLGGYGAINQQGLTLMVGLPLAVKCGVNNAEISQAIQRGKTFFSYYIDKGTIPYGDHKPNQGWFDDNGKSGSAAIAFDLMGDNEGAAFFSSLTLGAAPSGREVGHTGSFWSHLWGGIGTARAGREAMTAFMNELNWAFTLERHVSGRLVFQGNAGEAGKRGEPKTKTWDCTGARLLQLCVPRAKLYITGRDMEVKTPLTPERIEAIFAAGRLHTNAKSRAKLNWAEIKTLLADPLPAIRTVGATAMRQQNLNRVNELIAMLDSDNRYARYGACMALRDSAYGSQEAVERLTQLIGSAPDLNLRLVAIDALTGKYKESSLSMVAKDARPVLLRLAVQRFDIDPRRLLQRRLAGALFNRNGLITIHGIDDLDSDLLVPAIRELLTVDDGRARGTVGTIFEKLSEKDRKALWSDIYLATRDLSPSGIMFADQVRIRGLRLMQQHNVAEGVDLTLSFMQEDRWGQGHRLKAGLEILTDYGPVAKKALPYLQKVLQEKTKSGKTKPDELAAIQGAITAIEKGDPSPTMSIAEFIGETE